MRLAVVGAGPVGLTLALLAARQLPKAQVCVFDARPPDADLLADPRTLALALGSVQLLQGLAAWPGDAAAAITEVRVSQAPPGGAAEVRIRASEEGVPQLGAVLRYGPLLAALHAAWLAECARRPAQAQLRLGQPVAALKAVADGVEVDAGVAEVFDVAVVAEGGVFGQQPLKPVQRDYAQTAWVGEVTLAPGPAGVAIERFTRDGPIALLPLPSPDTQRRAALVWCVPTADDAVAPLEPAQRLALLRQRLPADVPLTAIGPLKAFALGLAAERTLVRGREVRIGNAAQTLHPVAGQGLNLGLRDAHELVAALRHAPDAGTALARFARQRRPDRWRTIATTDLLARAFTWPGVAGLGGAALTTLQALPPLRSALARQMMYGWR